MRRAAWLAAATAAITLGGVSLVSALTGPVIDPSTEQTCQVADELSGESKLVVCYDAATTTTTTVPSTTSTLPPTTTTTPPATTVPPVGVQFMETFTGNVGLDRFNHGVWHRDPYIVAQTRWTGDHDLNCGSPDTQRVIRRSNPDESFYMCKDHMMTSVGDTSGYSIAWFSPKQTFDRVRSVSFDVNLTNLGTRQWWKVGVVSEARYQSFGSSCCTRPPGFLASDVDAADLPTNLATDDLFVATWSGGLSGGYPGGLKVGNTNTNTFVNPTPNDKATRHPVSLVDNGDGTVTFTVAGVSVTRPGAFPAGPVRVVFYDHNYTPDKSIQETGVLPQGHTWHWDNIIIN